MDGQQPNQQPAAPQQTPAPSHPAGGQPNSGMAIVAYILFFIPLLTDAKNDPFVKFHVKQGIIIFGLAVILWIIRMMMPWYWLWNFYWIFNLVGLAILVFAILGIVNAANGKQEKLPLIGKLGDMFKF
ncbi:MAG: hypothetical protein NTW66_01900 [Candidatus Magasanikbacteria bacterium]|nr:hypothetical protein [Candidatus Magasanikbacteria bacterium]